MNECTTKHEIYITNLKCDDIIGHQIILFRGNVTGLCDKVSGKVVDTDTGLCQVFQVKGKALRVLWNLHSGPNHLKFSYCSSEISFTVTYEEAQSQYRVQPLYIACQDHDGHFKADKGKKNDVAEACRKITLNLKLVQCMYAESLLKHGQDRRTFCLNGGCEIFQSSLSANTAKQLDEVALWNEFGREIINSVYGKDEKLKFVAFIACTEYEEISDGDYSYDNIKRHTKAQANLGGGGLALFGSGYLYCWPSDFSDIIPCFENERLIDLKQFPDDSNYRRTYGGCYATTIGAVCHELGHVFDLGHTREGIMGSGFDYVNLLFTNKDLTEHLPDRIIDSTTHGAKDNRLTRIKQPGKFLQKYHEQKTGDLIFFTPNCATILSLHRWINTRNSLYSDFDRIELDTASLEVSSTSSYLRLIEIRDKQSNLVVDYRSFSLSAGTEELRRVNLNGWVDRSRHSIFVITSDGSTRFFSQDSIQG